MRESKPEHQLIECPEVQDNSYDLLKVQVEEVIPRFI